MTIDTKSEQGLWCAVLEHAINDAVNGAIGCAHRSNRTHETEKARQYFEKRSADFNTVCYLAGVDPDAVHERISKKIAEAPAIEDLFKGKRRYSLEHKELTVNGETRTYQEWANRSGKAARQIRSRIVAGWTPERAVYQPLQAGVGVDFPEVVGTGAGTAAQDTSNLSFLKKAS